MLLLFVFVFFVFLKIFFVVVAIFNLVHGVEGIIANSIWESFLKYE